MNDVTFTPVKSENSIAVLCKLADEIWHEHFIPIIGSKQVDYMIAKYQSVPAITNQIGHENYKYYFITLDTKVIGYFGFKIEEHTMFLSKFYIHKDYRGNGFARKAIEFLVEICKQNNLSKIWLTVNRFNSNTIAIYEKVDFSVVKTQKADIGNGFFMDDYIMEKEIK